MIHYYLGRMGFVTYVKNNFLQKLGKLHFNQPFSSLFFFLSIEVFVSNTNLAFLYIEGFKFEQKRLVL